MISRIAVAVNGALVVLFIRRAAHEMLKDMFKPDVVNTRTGHIHHAVNPLESR